MIPFHHTRTFVPTMLAQIPRQGSKCKRPQPSNWRLNYFVSNHFVLKTRPPNRSLQSWDFTYTLHLGVPHMMLHRRSSPFDKFIKCDNLHIILHVIYLQIYVLLYVPPTALRRFITLSLALAALADLCFILA